MLLISLISIMISTMISSVISITPSWPSPYWNIPGDYCKAKYPALNCCNGRQDPCSVEILGTLCYCDSFCNRTHNSDCCPDYFTHCEGLPPVNFEQNIPVEELSRPDGKISLIIKGWTFPCLFSAARCHYMSSLTYFLWNKAKIATLSSSNLR